MQLVELTNIEFWRTLLSNDFNRGYVAALLLMLGIILVLLILRFVLFLIFRNRHCSEFVVKSDGGDVVISQDAIENATRQVLDEYSALLVNRIRLFRRGGNYSMRIYCSFNDDGRGLPDMLKHLKPAITEMLKKTFGVDNLKFIRIAVESFSSSVPLNLSKPSELSEAPVKEAGSDAPLSL